MSKLSDDYIDKINRDYPNLNKDQESIVESLCDFNTTVVLKDRQVGSSTTILSYIIEYCLKNSGVTVFIKGSKDLFDKINPLVPGTNLLEVKQRYRKVFLNKSKILKYIDGTSFRSYKPDMIFVEEIRQYNEQKTEEILNDLKDMWGIFKPKVIIESGDHKPRSRRIKKFNNFLKKTKNNKNVNQVRIKGSINNFIGTSVILSGSTTKIVNSGLYGTINTNKGKKQ